jgi:outer membrane receptor protein involved in Fe transport
MRVGSFPSHFQYTPGNPGIVSPTFGYTDEYDIVNLMMGAYIGEHLSVTAYVENVADDHSTTYIHPEAFVDSRFGTLRPRTWGIRLGYDF